MKNKLNFRRVFISFSLFITCVPALIFSAYLLFEIKIQSTQTFKRDLASVSTSFQNFLKENFEDNDSLIQLFKYDSDISQFMTTGERKKRISEKFSLMLLKNKSIDLVLFYNLNNQLLDAYPASPKTLQNLKTDKRYLQLINDAKRNIRNTFEMDFIESTTLYNTIAANTETMPMHFSNHIALIAIPVLNDQKEPSGILVIASRADHYYKQIASFFPPSIFNVDLIYGNSSLTLKEFKDNAKVMTQYLDYPLNQISHLRDERLTIALSYDEHLGTKFVDEVIFKLIIIIMITLAGICLLTFKVSKWFLAPITQLNTMTQDYLAEEYRRKREHIKFTELDQVAEGAFTLANKIADKIDANATLISNQEIIIQTRTKMLQRSLFMGKEREKLLGIINDLAFDMQTYEEIEQLVEASLNTIQGVYNLWQTGILLIENKGTPAQQFLEGFSTIERSILHKIPAEIQMDAIERFMHNAMINLKQPIKQSDHWIGLPILDKNNDKLGILVMKGPPLTKAHKQTLHVFIKQLGGFLENKQLYRELEILASTDPLTGLYNRLYFDTHFKKAVYNLTRHPESHFSVFVIDVNRLKYINDEFGHEFGDAMLKKVAEVLKVGRRETDIVARIGGDEFFILLPDTTHEICEHLTNRFNEVQSDLFLTLRTPNGTIEKFKIHYSIGFASTDKVPSEKLIKIADERMYDAKQAYYTEHKLTQRKT